MTTQIINDVSCIRIINDNVPFIVHKVQVRAIDTIKDDIVRIDIGEGPLRNIYVRLSETTVPTGLTDVNALRDAIKAMLDTACAGNNTGGTTTIDLTPLITAIQADTAKLNDIENAINAQTQQQQAYQQQQTQQQQTQQTQQTQQQQTTTTGSTVDLSTLKQSMDNVSSAITNTSATTITELQSIHDAVNNNTGSTRDGLQQVSQQINNTGSTHSSLLNTIANASTNIQAILGQPNILNAILQLHGDVLSTGEATKDVLQGLAQQLSGPTSTQISMLASISAAAQGIQTMLQSTGTLNAIQSMHGDLMNSGAHQTGVLNGILQMLQTIHTSQSMNNAFLYPTRVDNIQDNVVYNGFAVSANTAVADGTWAIQRVTSDGRGLFVYEWANGNQQFNNVWNNRETLTYAPLTVQAQVSAATATIA